MNGGFNFLMIFKLFIENFWQETQGYVGGVTLYIANDYECC